MQRGRAREGKGGDERRRVAADEAVALIARPRMVPHPVLVRLANLPLIPESSYDEALRSRLTQIEARIASIKEPQRFQAPYHAPRVRSSPTPSASWKRKGCGSPSESRYPMSDKSEFRPSGGTIIDGVATSGGVHCETTTLGVLLRHAGLDLSEPMLFGLGSGLSFVYWDSKQQELPLLGGRVKPFALTQNLTRRLGIELRAQETTSARKAWDRVRSSIDDGTPVGLQLDSHYLEYFGSRVHFAGHFVAMYGYDTGRAYLVDTAQQGGAVSTSLESLARARAARGPMSACHRSVTVAASGVDAEHLASAVVPAITECAEAFLAPPIANLGSRGSRTRPRRHRHDDGTRRHRRCTVP